MKSKFALTVLVLALVAAGEVKAQELEPKHEVRISYSDATPLTFANALGRGLSDAFSFFGSSNTKSESIGMFNLAYRTRISRKWSLGGDVSFNSTTGDTKSENVTKHFNTKNILIMPEAEFSYIRTGMIDFYGNVSAGVNVASEKETAMGKSTSDTYYNFAFQVNPVGLRVGRRLGAFAELGLGYKGYVNAGVSYRF